MKKSAVFLILLNVCLIVLAFWVKIPLPFHEWRKGPPIHTFSAYSSGNAERIFWIATVFFIDLYSCLTALFYYMIRKRHIFLSRKVHLAGVIVLFTISFLLTEELARLFIKSSSGYTQFRPHPVLYWYNRSNLHSFIERSDISPISTNRYGFRCADIQREKPSGEYRIFVFGDSSAFGHGVCDEETFSARLEKKLNDKHKRHKFRVINAACPGHTTYQGLKILKNEVLRFNPDMLIVSYNNDPGLEYAEEKERAFKNPFMERLNIALYHSDYYLLFQRATMDLKIFLLTKFKKGYSPSFVRRISLDDYRNNIREFIKIAEEYNMYILFIKMPVNFDAFKEQPDLKKFFYDERYRDALTEICAENHQMLIDVNNNWADRSKRDLFEIIHYDGKESRAHFHPSAKGHEDIAGQIYNAISLRKIRIGCSSLTPLHCMIGEVFSRTDILKKHGFEGEIVFFEHGYDQSVACKAGKIDATFSCEVPAVYHLAECPDLRIVGTPGALGRIALIVSSKGEADSIGDLRNKTVFIQGGSSSMMMAEDWFSACGLKPGIDVKFIDSKATASGFVLWDPWLEEFLKQNDFKIVRERLFYSVIFMSDKYLESFPDAVVRYKEALKEAFIWALGNKEDVVKWVSGRSGIKEDIIASILGFNENWSLEENEKANISLDLTPWHEKLLQECGSFAIKNKDVPSDFDIEKRIVSGVFNGD